MLYPELSNLIFEKLKSKLEGHAGLSIFARERAKFEGWFKVELCDSLCGHFADVCPEKKWVDVSFMDWAIELKTINTNLKYKGVVTKTKPITDNVNGVIEDIQKLRRTTHIHKGVIFIVFPAEHENKDWQVHLQKICANLADMRHCHFKFHNSIPGIIYFGLV